MADEQTPETEAAGGKKKLIIIVVALVVLMAVGGGAAFFLLGSGDEEPVVEDVAAIPVVAPASYVNIAQPFLFNASDDKRDRMVQIKVQLMVRGSENEQLARHHSPLIESTLLATFGVATVDQLRSPMGRTKLRDQATEDIKAALTELVGQPVIEKVLFTDFVMQ